MTRTISDRISENAARTFVGREAELAVLRSAVLDPDRVVALVHGPGGIGKTRLLRAVLGELPVDTAVTVLDGRDVEPTPEGVLRALERALGTPDVVTALGTAPRHVLAIDTYEVLGLADTWTRTTFLPMLPTSVFTVLVGRDRPASAWHTAPGWAGSVVELCVGPLPPGPARELLRARGLDEAEARRADDFAHGHPLALELAAATSRGRPGAATSPATAGGPVPGGLLDCFVDGLSPEATTALEAASTTRWVTEPLLAAVLDRGDHEARAAYDGLRRLPFVDATTDGLVLHDVVRDTVGHDLAVRDPERRRRYRRRAASFLAGRPPSRDDLWQRTADLMFLIENPVVRDACFPSARPTHVVEPARREDATAIAEIALAHEPAPVAEALARWWASHPETFAVARDPDGAVAAFVQIAELGTVDPDLLGSDPVARPWLEHLRENPPAPEERVLLMRRWLGRESGELRSPAVSACWLDVKRTYMQWRPRLRRLYSTVVDLPRLGPIFLPLGFAPAGPGVGIEGTTYQPVWLDFGPQSVDGWLARLVDTDLDVAPPDDGCDATDDCSLSPREREVLALLADGLSNRDIGARLYVSEKTAGRHVSNIFTKLEVHTRAQAARLAAERGWL
ncbi:LuxR family transcriptional regulator [Actinomycetospora termitidis]|uniref:LuxR family transcriptional regulator n=1 Tax=Actinomycetospora termitidis TaxID=3053470 RepID=A0ABT7MEC5_9PSEU|nr:LuxR family transcriptional regulator [Actinomycetospora sp. Odt1-22]MDL5158352.1 LuxR family transcriptional regulator [Actinomycetospora sp. Odt1-22]